MDFNKDKSSNDDRIFAMLIYVSSFFTTFIGPLIIWLVKKDSPFVDYHGKAYFNFLISYAIYSFVAWILIFVLIGFIILPIIGIMAFVFTIIAAVKSYEGQDYHIPLTIRFIK
ncbi:DUF4870 domain-containing protein [Cytobacillus oceanisediminis]|uniref:DUF4870 domain-containing protein n=1 Tax=Niallia alba TaxID=2729105 RepID=A0A7Y0PP46_9BACI|nr:MULTISPECIES: DUF4870 domain-containing protein [Bacillaceae]MBQ6447551.1 DUF4870 domain-containing protein [Bacillus sp. (in: firmicutes)]MBZ9536071.1 DUF4870 domain-containing protein [Cytobacillus oceanisediminis]MDU1846252.1 DUF4870 domain-containing protein [Niallia nealsonii]NMO78124.1 DUF4870 domain-containing protein [Niallia alba]